MSAQTEAEADKKWCPLARVNCIGCACMMWRWSDPPTKTEAVMTRAEAEELGGPDTVPVTREVPTPNRRGYCGLAGRP